MAATTRHAARPLCTHVQSTPAPSRGPPCLALASCTQAGESGAAGDVYAKHCGPKFVLQAFECYEAAAPPRWLDALDV